LSSPPAAGADGPPDLGRLSLNQITTERLSLPEAVDACARAGVTAVGLWRHKVAEVGLATAARLVRQAGLRVSSLCRGGMFPAATAAERAARLDDNRRAVEEAAELGADVLVLVCGPAPDKDLAAARAMVAEGVATLAEHARRCGVRLGIEPLHPVFAADRSVVTTLDEANTLAERHPADLVGVVVDTYHVWWDPALERQLARARGRIFGLHVCDWLLPVKDPLMGRGIMGDGVIDIRRIRRAVEAAGYRGPIEVEIFNQAVWDAPADEVLARIRERYLRCV
jgi:sugar phosphate isomerase/epimerase